jgi:DNA-directed RNA polymerase specialized sigma24 family protein
MSSQRRTMKEKRLIERCRAGDNESWRKFLRHYERMLINAVRFWLRKHSTDPNQIEDLVAQVEVKFWKRLQSGLWRGAATVAVLPYLMCICRNVCLDWLRTRRQVNGHAKPVRLEEVPDREHLTQDEFDEALAFTATLPPRQAQAFLQLLGQSVNDPVILSAANRRKLKQLLQRKFEKFHRRIAEPSSMNSDEGKKTAGGETPA